MSVTRTTSTLRKRTTRAARVAWVAAMLAWPIATACSGGSTAAPAGSGDDFTNDTRDSSVRAAPNPDPGDDAGPDANPNIGPPYGSEGGTYPGLAECSGCTCDPAKYYCFGGATARAAFTPLAKDAGAGDAGLPACVIVDASTPQLGCNPIPDGCATSPTPCGCIINALQPAYSCIFQCAGGPGEQMTAYCQNY